MEFLKAALKGIVIGVANVIPGVSGGTMMVSMGVYDTLLSCITGLFKQFKKSILTLLPYVVGAAVGIVALASVLKYLFSNYPLPTYTAFIGLILGGVSPLLKLIDKKKINALAMLLFVLFAALIIFMALSYPEESDATVNFSLAQAGILLVMGVIASATMIIPGVSGSMVLMLLGYYQTILNAIDGLKSALFAADLGMALTELKILVPFGIGVVIGIYAVAKLIEWLIARFPQYTYVSILGLVVASPAALLIRCDMSGVTPLRVLVSLITFIAGFLFSAWLARLSDKPKALNGK